jgi:hypothetical protein
VPLNPGSRLGSYEIAGLGVGGMGEQFSWRNRDVSPDGKRFIAPIPAEPESAEIRIVLNWFRDLKQRVPIP